MQSNAAPVYSLADEQRARAESAAWSRFAAAADSQDFYAGWLALLSARVNRSRAALLLLGEQENGPFTVAAAWPDPQRDLQYLGAVAQRTLAERQGVVSGPEGRDATPDGPAHVGYPLQVDGRLHGAVVFDVGAGPQADLQAALRQIHWASAWLIDHFRARALAHAQAELARVGQLNEIMATGLQQRRLKASTLAVANELAARLQCDRVSIGLEKDDRMKLLAMSHTATFDKRSDQARALRDAMEEVLDLGVPVMLPRPPGDELGALAHQQATHALDSLALLSVPVVSEARTLGVITLERSQGPAFSAEEQSLARAAAMMLGPVWALQRANERGEWERLADHGQHGLQALAGPRHPGLKLGLVLGAAALLFVSLWHTEHRVAARTLVEGGSTLARVAPFDGYLAQALVRAGDTVKLGQPMARLQDKDLLLERTRWQAELEQAQRKYQVAMAQADRGSMGVLAAQAHQAEAQLALVQERLSRAEITAPFDGLVVSGDLSQAIGTPVEQGRTLFEVAPLQGFRVVMQVDDRDIARVAVGQKGELVLASQPDRALPFNVSSVTSVATQVDGRNVFRVEAAVQGEQPGLRPGMEGVGKVAVGERSLLWIWTHNFVDWLRLSFWSWMP